MNRFIDRPANCAETHIRLVVFTQPGSKPGGLEVNECFPLCPESGPPISPLKLDVDWVILSACNTAAVIASKEDWVVGTIALSSAGCP